MANIAHRGASGHAPEHTVAAFDIAIELGAEYLEFDVQLTADGVLVVFHDLISSRTLRGVDAHGVISEMTFEQLRHADAGCWFNKDAVGGERRFDGQSVLTLPEVLQRYRHLARFAIELKSRDGAKSGIERKVLRTLADHRLLGDGGRVVLMSLSAVSPARLHSLAPAIDLVQLFYEHETATEMLDRLHHVGRYAGRIGPHHTQVTEKLVRAAHAEGMGVWTWAVNAVADMERLLAAGVDGIVTDFPDRLSSVLEARRTSLREARGDSLDK